MATRRISLKLNDSYVFSLEAIGDEATVNYMFDKIMMDTFGVLYKLRNSLAEQAINNIKEKK